MLGDGAQFARPVPLAVCDSSRKEANMSDQSLEDRFFAGSAPALRPLVEQLEAFRDGMHAGTIVSAWYAVEVKRHNERRGEWHLSRKGISVLLPFIEITRRYRTRRVAVLEPLFPGYLFAHMEPMEATPELWQALRWAPGVKRILGAGDVPVPVADAVIDSIRERTRALGFVRSGLRHAPGSRVRIIWGPLAGLEAVFDRPMSRAGRVRVLLDLLGQQARVEVDAFDLEVV